MTPIHITPRTRPRTRRDFMAYVSGFYAQFYGAEWPGGVPTAPEIDAATTTLLERYDLVNDSHPLGALEPMAFDGGSHDREVVRDIILARRGEPIADLEHGATVARMS